MRERPPHVLGAGNLAKVCPFTFHSTLLVPTKALGNPSSLFSELLLHPSGSQASWVQWAVILASITLSNISHHPLSGFHCFPHTRKLSI